ncbi:MAG: hypothetical protein ACI4SQ_03795 [Eubacterium sp.]
MKRKILFIMLLACFLFGMTTQPIANLHAAKTMSEWKKQKTGSAGVLTGKNVLVSIFVEDADSKWSEKQKKEANRKLKVAAAFIEAQGKKYKKNVTLIADSYANPELQYEIKTKLKLEDSEKKLNRFTKQMQTRIEQFVKMDEIREKYGTDSIGFLLFVNKSGVSSTAVHYVEDGTKNFYEMSALFSCYEKESEGAATYAHEILHLFGARDLYMTSITDGISSALVRYIGKKYPNDIMFSTFTKNGKTLKYKIVNQVDRVTAFYLGWKNTIPEKKKFALSGNNPKGCFTDGTTW